MKPEMYKKGYSKVTLDINYLKNENLMRLSSYDYKEIDYKNK